MSPLAGALPGAAPAGVASRPGRFAALLPLGAALAVVALAAAAGVTQASLDAAGFGQWTYGFFADRYPLFFAAIAYGVVRVALLPLVAPKWRGWLGALLGAALVIVLSLHPTYGGLVLRAGFSVGGVTFLSGQPLALAQGLGAVAAASLLGAALGLAALVARGLPRRGGWGRALVRGLLRFLALAWALGVLASARDLGLSGFPRSALSGAQAGLAMGIVLMAFLPHALLGLVRPRASVESTPGRR
ncbi:hypothetical protein LRS73_02130 [Methylobacterium currus]|uniref:hypothetical protein n=1 Tax=Methylobacterium currus TaxID=2051553 RepID=UPI001E4BAA6E|nr:hypothetical protein [Methylobacterium currus]UHC16744.1 hypothetical protein LRS73_02130 [Methylobacterium currus]